MNPLSWWLDYLNGALDAHLVRLAQWRKAVFDPRWVATVGFLHPSEGDGPIAFAPRADRTNDENTPVAPSALPKDDGVERVLSKLAASPTRPSKTRYSASKPAASV